MKKIAIIVFSLMFILTGCGKKSPEDLVAKFKKNVNNSKSYILKGNMEILSNEETYTYSIEANYLESDFYKVTLVNQTNNHEQIILKNKDGVYVVTPTLNKSFKFQSEWPDNSSQSYILASLIKDIDKDKKRELSEQDKNYVLKTSVNYPNNADLKYQKIYFDKDMNLEKVEVYDANDTITIKAEFASINLKANLKEEDFALEDLVKLDETNNTNKKDKKSSGENSNINNNTNYNNNTDNSNNENTENKNNDVKNNNTNKTPDTDNSNQNSNNNINNNTNSNNSTDKSNCANEECDTKSGNIIDSIIYPLYIPSETYLSNSEKIDTDEGNRVILTFAGGKNFVLIEEAATVSSEFEIIPVYGDPVMLNDTIAAKSANSLYWTSADVSYYLTSSDLSTKEMVTIAESLGNTKVVSTSK